MDDALKWDSIVMTLKKYRYAILVLIAGLFLMLLPQDTRQIQEPVPEQTTQQTAAEGQKELETSLENILRNVEGAGNVQVLLTEKAGEEIVYQRDGDSSFDADSGNESTQTVIITNQQRGEVGLVRQTNPPVYQGAIVVCQGADRAEVRLAMVEAVANATGLTTDKITILKMK